MEPTMKLTLFLIFFRIAFASTVEDSFGHCERVVKNWASSSLHDVVNQDKHTLQDLLFFLHVPRTGGRSYYHCFLNKLYPSSQECPRSYDKLRFDPSKPKCRLLATHDDYSVMHKLPKERTSVVTIVRNPVDRVFSSYEFAVEVAARFLVHQDLASVTKLTLSLRKKGVSTLDIWPWKHLVPWMRGDLFARRDARKLKGSDEVKSNNPYDMEEMVMPLQEYINDPITHDIVHNGATFQIAGLTNNSYLAESHKIRHCVQNHKSLGEHVLHVAKKRLDDMLYVGLTAKHKESAAMFANVVGAQVISQLRDVNFTMDMENIAENQPGNSSSHLDSDLKKSDVQSGTLDDKATGQKDVVASKENMTVSKLIGVYEECISNLRKTQSRRRFVSLKRISPANFSKEARLRVPENVLQQIRTLNYLDMELFNYAQKIFSTRHENIIISDGVKDKFENPPAIMLWKFYSLAMIFGIFLFLFIFMNARRRMSKIKI